jgi:hypothetical protein
MKWKRIVLFLLAVPIVILLALLLFAEWAWGGYIKPTLDPQYIPTAEYLLQNPIPTPDFISVNPPPGSVVSAADSIIVHVPISPNAPLGSKDEIANWTFTYLNRQRIPRSNFGVTFSTVYSSDGPGVVYIEYADFIFPLSLSPGLHILEIRVGKSVTVLFNPAEAYTYTWAYKVE